MTTVYLDSSAVLKRVLVEDESLALSDALDRYAGAGDSFVSSTLAWLEVTRALRRMTGRDALGIADEVEAAFAGAAEVAVSAEIVSLARRVGPHRAAISGLRSTSPQRSWSALERW